MVVCRGGVHGDVGVGAVTGWSVGFDGRLLWGPVAADSVGGVLHGQCLMLLPDGMFADLSTDVGRRGVPPVFVVVGMVL